MGWDLRGQTWGPEAAPRTYGIAVRTAAQSPREKHPDLFIALYHINVFLDWDLFILYSLKATLIMYISKAKPLCSNVWLFIYSYLQIFG